MKAAEFDAGHCAVELPAVREAFERGDLSLEKVRLISTVANEESQDEWVGQAMRTTPGELARHAREVRTPGRDDPEGDRLQRSLRHLNYRNDEIGMLRISGALPKAHGHAVRAVLDQYANSLREQGRRGIRVEIDPPEDQQGAHRADALVALCLAAAGGGADARPLPVTGSAGSRDARGRRSPPTPTTSCTGGTAVRRWTGISSASAPSIIRACIAGSGGSSAPRREICSSSGGMVS